jgi:hypothetical protein
VSWPAQTRALALLLPPLVVLAAGCSGGTPSTTPKQEPKARARSFTVGINAGGAPVQEAELASRLRPSVVRVDYDISTPVSEIAPAVAALASRGERVQLVAGFIGRTPSTDDGVRLAAWAHAFGPGGSFWRGRSDGAMALRYIEFGNETNQGYQYDDCGPGCPDYGARARAYALGFRYAEEAIQSAEGNRRVGLLAVSDDSGSAEWADHMYEAVPDLNSRVAGWIEHPYGPDYRSWIGNLLKGVAHHGGDALPVFVTEFGISSDDGRCLSDNYGWPKCLTYQQAADRLRRSIAGMRSAYGRQLAQVLIFSQVDAKPSGTTSDREAYFGAVRSDGGDKGALTTTVRDLLAAYRG